MIDNSWVFDLETKIYSRVKVNALKKLKDKYPKINFTTSDRNQGDPIYPTVYIHELPANEIGKDITGDAINGVSYTMQVEVIADTSQEETKEIMKVIMLEFKKLKFNINVFPSFENGNTYYRSVSRCQRIFGCNDIF